VTAEKYIGKLTRRELSAAQIQTDLEELIGLEARVGIEPTMQLLQSRALPLGYPARRSGPNPESERG